MANVKTASAGLDHYRANVKAEKYQAILKAAHETFLTEGFHKAQMGSVAKSADVSTATLYKYFHSKEELFIEVLKDIYSPKNLDDEYLIGNDDARHEIFKWMKAFVLNHTEHNSGLLLHVARIEVASAAALAHDISRQQSQFRYLELRKLLDQLVERGDLRPHDTNLGARQISGMTKEALIWLDFCNDIQDIPASIDKIIEQAITTYLSRFAAKPPHIGTEKTGSQTR